ncbi:MAG: phytanoyl-CoA dioxygenase family protein, partial [Candidatus Latescibacteria bacterium]|nr:phytanoyl-CoA dioxygenase family protein [Candidatus Latescibacterota bacterium]
WDGICDVMGGAERIEGEPSWGDGFIINFHKDADDPRVPSAKRGGWHKDGNFFRHFLDSPEQGLLTVVVWDDVLPNSGGTYLAPDSVPKVARFLYDHPEGLEPGSFGKMIEGCEEFVEATGNAGDVYLIHPYMLHSAAPNPSGRPRFITNPPVAARIQMIFHWWRELCCGCWMPTDWITVLLVNESGIIRSFAANESACWWSRRRGWQSLKRRLYELMRRCGRIGRGVSRSHGVLKRGACCYGREMFGLLRDRRGAVEV